MQQDRVVTTSQQSQIHISTDAGWSLIEYILVGDTPDDHGK